MSTTLHFITAEEFAKMPEGREPLELERGRIVMMSRPGVQHGRCCNLIGYWLQHYLQQHPIGYVLNNDTGVITERGPDTVRGPDVAYYSRERLPKGLPAGYADQSPEVIFEVLSPNDRRAKVLRRVSEYLNAGTLAACVVDPRKRIVCIYFPDADDVKLSENDVFELPNILPGFAVAVHELFGPP